MGDFNRDLLQVNTKKTWLEYMESFGLEQIVKSPTRITDHSETLIDHIYCNNLSNVLSTKVPILGLSDHFPVFVTRKLNSSSVLKKSHHSISYRSFKNFNEAEFINDLSSTPWDVIKIFDDTNDIVESWSSLFLDIIDKHLPLKQHRVKRKQQPKWLNGEIIDAIKTRDRYKSINDNEQYKIWRNKVCSLIKQAKKHQYSEILNENANNPASVWKLFKEIGASKCKDSCGIFSLNVDNNSIENPKDIADQFNKYFVSVSSKIKEPPLASNFDKLKEFCDKKIPANTYFSIPCISQEKIEKYLKNIDITKATGSDNIGARLLKLAAPFISDSLMYICNQSILNSTFPDKWKEGKVRPLYKNGPKDDTNNYRPISILPVISKMLEKHVHDSLMTYLTSHKLLHSTQSGFRPNHSCETALLQMVNKFLEAINSSQIIGMVMVDFRKAFDLVDHTLLLKKLRHYKLSDKTINWFSSYLLDRKQKVVINNIESRMENVLCGVPQGSILGPLLFLMFINDLPLYANNVATDLYADDTTLYMVGETQEYIEQNLQMALQNLSEWCKLNGMLLNTDKTKAMLITTSQKRLHLKNDILHLTYNNDVLNSVENEKVLGVRIDNNLTWSIHINFIAKKISSNLWLLSKLKDYLSTEHRVQFYKTYIQPHIDYCSTIWGGTSQYNLNRINWFSSYLLDRKQKVVINNIESRMENVLCGVPQGSILGPLLFLMFINDLPLYANNVATDLYADDTTLYMVGETQEYIEQNLQMALQNLSEWCKLNGMLLNTDKTKAMLITTSQKRLHLKNDILHLTYNNDVLNSVENEKVLGVRIDNNLTWSIHINFIAKKISSNLWLLSKLKDYLSTEHRVQFYKTYIQPHIDYCSTIWGGTSQYNLNRIYRLQKRAVKIIVNYQYDNIANSMDELKILNIYERIFLRKAKFMFKVSKSVLPSYVNEMFSFRPFNETLQSLRSTGTLDFYTPRPQKEIFKQSLIYSGPVIWNNLPDCLKFFETVDSFHRHCIKWMKSSLSFNL